MSSPEYSMIHVEGLTKLYGNRVGVAGVSFDVDEGKVAGLLGPNGAGKSTIMKLLTGYLAPDSGQVTIGDVDVVLDYRAAASKIGYAPEIPPLFPDMTVHDYLYFVADLKGIKKSDRITHINTVMEMSRIVDVGRRLIKNLSKGYKQRVGIAQALIAFPPVLILDEPASGLDPTQIAQLRELLRSLAGKHTIILSSHILAEIGSLCEEVIVINNGRVAAQEKINNDQDKGSTFLLVLRTNDRDKALACAGSVPGVAEALPVSSDSETFSIKVQFNPGKKGAAENTIAARTALFHALSVAKLPILELVRERENLEDLYMRVTVGASQ